MSTPNMATMRRHRQCGDQERRQSDSRKRVRVSAKHRSGRAQFLFAGPQLLPPKPDGGTVGGPIKKRQIFYFADYQGTRTAQGIDTGLIPVPTLAERSGNFGSLPGTVSGPYLANLLSQKARLSGFGERAVQPGFSRRNHPARVWSAPAQHLLQYIPLPTTDRRRFRLARRARRCATTKAASKWTRITNAWGCCRLTISSTTTLEQSLPHWTGRRPAFPALTR